MLHRVLGVASAALAVLLVVPTAASGAPTTKTSVSTTAVTSAAFSGGAGTVVVGGTLLARSGGSLTLTVGTTGDVRCLVVSGAHSAKQTSKTSKTGWTFAFTAPTGDVARTATVRAYTNLKCSGSSVSRSAGYVSDNTGAATTADLSSGNAAGTHPDPVEVTLTGADAGSGVASVLYRIDGGSTQLYAAPFTVSGAGGHTIDAWSMDRLGLVGAVVTRSFTIDETVLDPSGVLEAELLTNVVHLVDSTATGGTAAQVLTGAYAAGVITVAPGSYRLTARVRSTGSCPHLGLAGQLVTRRSVTSGGWEELSAPVRVTAADPTIGVLDNACYDGSGTSALYVDWVSLTPADAVHTTLGRFLLDPSGAQVRPRGVNRNGYELDPNHDMRDHGFAKMKEWGATVVRLHVSSVFWLSQSCHHDPGYASKIDAAVQSITSRGMIALVDLHTNRKDVTYCGPLPPPQQKMADASALDYWRQVADRYKPNPLVAFDLYNEPHDISEAVWRNGGLVDGTWRAVGMQQMYDAVRSTGADNLVFVSGLDWAKDLTVALRAPVYGHNIVYSSHAYHGDTCGGVDTTLLDAVVGQVAARYPVVMSEFGSSCGTGTFNRSVIDWAESKGIGWAAFAWNAAGKEAWSLLESWDTYAPSAAGRPVYDTLQAHKVPA